MLWVGQFGIVDGEAREESPWIGVFPDTWRAEPEDTSDLFVVVEPALEGSEDYCRDLADVIGKQFRERRLSLTGGILRSLNAPHHAPPGRHRAPGPARRVLARLQPPRATGRRPPDPPQPGSGRRPFRRGADGGPSPAAGGDAAPPLSRGQGDALLRRAARRRPHGLAPPRSTMLVLGIETSCDETAAAVVRDGRRLLSSVLSSQVELHARYGGVVPELASRQHVGAIIP